ncbi:hypothetical protein [Herbidospora mongoliensis]|nr:hypothetical protein [Herbidospora mongoliensis]
MRRVLAYVGVVLLVMLGSLASAAGVVFATGDTHAFRNMISGTPPCP